MGSFSYKLAEPFTLREMFRLTLQPMETFMFQVTKITQVTCN